MLCDTIVFIPTSSPQKAIPYRLLHKSFQVPLKSSVKDEKGLVYVQLKDVIKLFNICIAKANRGIIYSYYRQL